MAFIFSTSHLPETLARRPDHLEEEEEDDDTLLQPPPRAGGVHAFSHLPVRDNPAPSTGPLSTRPAIPVGRPRPYVDPEADAGTDEDRDTDHAPEPDSGHEDNDAPRAHDAYADDTPWHQPRIPTQDLPPQHQSEDAYPRQAEDHPDSPTFRSPSSSRSFIPSQQGLHDSFHSTARESLPLPFEEHGAPPSFLKRQQVREDSGPSSQPHLQGSLQVIAASQQAHGAKASAQGGRPAAQPPQALAQARHPAADPARNAPAAPQALAGQAAAEKPAAQASDSRIKIDAANPQFEAAANAALLDEAAHSPLAAELQKEAARLGISILPKRIGPSETKLQDGWPVIYFNPSSKTDITMSHEIAHAIQIAAFQQHLKNFPGDTDGAIQAGRDALNRIAPVVSDKDVGQDYKENQAMRISNIVNAERTASEMKDLPEEQKTLEEFLRRQAAKEKAAGEREKGKIHQNNTYPIPPGTERGRYDYKYVRDVLSLDDKGKKIPRTPAPAKTPPSP